MINFLSDVTFSYSATNKVIEYSDDDRLRLNPVNQINLKSHSICILFFILKLQNVRKLNEQTVYLHCMQLHNLCDLEQIALVTSLLAKVKFNVSHSKNQNTSEPIIINSLLPIILGDRLLKRFRLFIIFALITCLVYERLGSLFNFCDLNCLSSISQRIQIIFHIFIHPLKTGCIMVQCRPSVCPYPVSRIQTEV